MTATIKLTAVKELEDGSMEVELDLDEEGKTILMREGFSVITYCGIYKVDLSEVGPALEMYAQHKKRERQLDELMDDMYDDGMYKDG
jgi:hypothetical protein